MLIKDTLLYKACRANATNGYMDAVDSRPDKTKTIKKTGLILAG
uniref:Uncharacterized protein n=1 Tax=Rheinheimera sp. BAL341 TaxID=1708203 RepID=A0A486XQH4_9GAMM